MHHEEELSKELSDALKQREELIQKMSRAITHAHEWLERVEERRTHSSYFGLDHKIGENVDGCDLCSAWHAAKQGYEGRPATGAADWLCQNCGKDYFVEETIIDGELRCSCSVSIAVKNTGVSS